MYCRFRYASAPSWTARWISRIRSFPDGLPSTHTVSPIPDAIATPAQISANSTACSLKKLATITQFPLTKSAPSPLGAARFLSQSPGARAY